MLKKLLKHEYKATARFFLPVYGIFGVTLVIQRLGSLVAEGRRGTNDVINLILSIVTFFSTMAMTLGGVLLLASPMIYCVIRFWRNMLGDEGYLTHTLPVTAGQNILAKLIVSVSWMAATGLVAGLGGTLYALTVDAGEVARSFGKAGVIFSHGMELYGGWLVVLLILIILNVLAQMAYAMLTAYSAMSIGQTASRHKLLASVGTYVGIFFVTSITTEILVMIFVMMCRGTLAEWMVLNLEAGPATCGVLLLTLLGSLALSAIHFFLSRHFLSKKLNLA